MGVFQAEAQFRERSVCGETPGPLRNEPQGGEAETSHGAEAGATLRGKQAQRRGFGASRGTGESSHHFTAHLTPGSSNRAWGQGWWGWGLWYLPVLDGSASSPQLSAPAHLRTRLLCWFVLCQLVWVSIQF